MSYDAAKPFHAERLDWTEERVSELKRLHAKGYSASQIAKHLGGCTRNAVIGKINRLGLLCFRRINKSPIHLKGAIDGRTKRHTRKSAISLRPKKSAAPALATVSTDALNVALLDLKTGMCRWPVSDGQPRLFCGCQWEGEHGPYCKDHRVLAHVPYTKPKKIRPPREHFSGDWQPFGMWMGKVA